MPHVQFILKVGLLNSPIIECRIPQPSLFLSHVRIFKHYIPSPLIVLGVVEFVVLACSPLAGSAVRFEHWDLFPWSDRTLILSSLLYAFICLGGTAAMGVYSAGYRQGTGAMVVRTIVSYCLLSVALLTIIYYIFPSLFLGRGILAYAILFSLVTVIPIRYIFFKLVDGDSLRSCVLVVGCGRKAAELEGRLQSGHSGVADVVGFMCTNPEEPVAVTGKVYQHERPLLALMAELGASEVVVALDDRRSSDGSVMPLEELLDCKMKGYRITEAVGFFERELGILELGEIRPGWMVFASGFTNSVVWDGIKRFFDLLISIVLLILAWPLMLFAVVAIFLETGRPILYSQLRVGLNGKPFKIYKFRSMRTDAESAGKAIWADKKDSRVTRIGALLRNTRIDELPQIYNVLAGDMSIVGPRPERPEFVEELNKDIAFYKERHRVKPGLMGWAQLNYPYGASVKDAAEKLRYDLYYVKNRSLLLDFIIMVQTVQVILLGTGVR